MKIEKKFILIVDDEPDMLWALEHTLERGWLWRCYSTQCLYGARMLETTQFSPGVC